MLIPAISVRYSIHVKQKCTHKLIEDRSLFPGSYSVVDVTWSFEMN